MGNILIFVGFIRHLVLLPRVTLFVVLALVQLGCEEKATSSPNSMAQSVEEGEQSEDQAVSDL